MTTPVKEKNCEDCVHSSLHGDYSWLMRCHVKLALTRGESGVVGKTLSCPAFLSRSRADEDKRLIEAVKDLIEHAKKVSNWLDSDYRGAGAKY